jgi:putative MFS transporter
MAHREATRNPFNIIVVVAALGYFVDIYDLILFGIVRTSSLRDLGIADQDILAVGNHLLSMQMIGMLLGGIVWGVLGDKRGRLSILFLTIFLYSIANIANGFVTDTGQYAWMRLLAGFGLAGELGVGITLVSEVMTRDRRGLGASIVSGIGILGAVLGFLVAEQFNWRTAYFTGGGLGLVLLVMRLAVYESGMYRKTKDRKVSTGDFLSLFTNLRRFRKYMLAVLVGVPVWYTVSVLAIPASEFAREALAITGEVKGSTAVMLHYIGGSLGSIGFGLLSQRLRSRKKAILAAVVTIALLTTWYFTLYEASAALFYSVIFLLGVPMGGLWAVFMASASEQFGTNLRATVTTTAPNFVRGSTVLILMLLGILKEKAGLLQAGAWVGVICIGIAIVSAVFMEETFHKDLDYVEEEATGIQS